jgi:hypothetical protein
MAGVVRRICTAFYVESGGERSQSNHAKNHAKKIGCSSSDTAEFACTQYELQRISGHSFSTTFNMDSFISSVISNAVRVATNFLSRHRKDKVH